MRNAPMMNSRTYSIKPVYHNESLVDFKIESSGRCFMLLGRFHERFLNSVKEELKQNLGCLPVLIGAATKEYLGHVLKIHPGPLAVVDREEMIMQAAGTLELMERFKDRILFINTASAREALSRLTRWQWANSCRPFIPVAVHSYLRLDQDYYKSIFSALKASNKCDFWSRTRYPRFRNKLPRILLITSSYFLMGEIIASCQRLGIEHRFLNLENQEVGKDDFVRDFLQAVVEFRPDFVFTINHLGIDREGILLDLLERMKLPLASWFVDNPHLVLYLYANLNSSCCSIFSWDADNIQSLKALGFENVYYLPLATDVHRFSPGKVLPGFAPEARDVSFVGNSMSAKVSIRLEKVRAKDISGLLADSYQRVAARFVGSSENLVYPLLAKEFPELWPGFESLPGVESRLDFETLVTWEATRVYRKTCLEQVMSFRPLIAGDQGWKDTFAQSDNWDYHPEFNYYADLPGFYPHARVNFNATSAQMKGAVNQRVFDVPACGSFLITDYRRQIEDLLEPGKEVIYYREVGEIRQLIRHYLTHPEQRKKIALAARKRILAEHSYDHRLLEICRRMKDVYG